MNHVWKLGAIFAVAGLLVGCNANRAGVDGQIEPSPQAASGSDGARSLARLSDDGAPQAAAPVTVANAPDGTPVTFVGKKAAEIEGDFGRLQQSVQGTNSAFNQTLQTTRTLAQEFYTLVGAINARLQVGTTPGNPNVVRQWTSAQNKLSEINTNVLVMEDLRGKIAAESRMTGYLLEQIQAAYGLSGAIDADHRRLEGLEDTINQSSVTVERLLGDIDENVGRQRAYIANQQRTLTTLALGVKNGELFGPNLAAGFLVGEPPSQRGVVSARSGANLRSSVAPAAKPVRKAVKKRAVAQSTRKPIIIINFGSPNPSYEADLYTAISEVVARRPNSSFEVLGVSPGASAGAAVTSVKRSSQKVVRSLINMGVPKNRVRESTKTDPSVPNDQVFVYAL